MAYLEVIAGPQRGQCFALVAGCNVIGRDESCEVTLLDETTSRRHVAIHLETPARLEDVGSANGTRLNGERVACSRLSWGDQIHLGQTVLRFCEASGQDTVILGGEKGLSEVVRIAPSQGAGRQRPGEAQERFLRRLQSICRVGEEVADQPGTAALAQAVIVALARELSFERGAIEISGVRTIAFDGSGNLLGREFQLSRGLTEPVRQTGQALLFAVEQDSELAERQSVVEAGTTSAICVPLVFRDSLVGLIYLDRRGEQRFTSGDLALGTDLARQIGLSLGQNLALESLGGGDPLIAIDPASLAVIDVVDKAAPTPAPILLLGETGVGKEVYARRIHQNSARPDGPFVALNMAALPDALVESELFGHEAGAFTGANTSSPGKFRIAHGGTLFLDEVGELPAEIQAKLLRVLEAHEFYPVGASEPVQVDVRILAATNQNLSRAVSEGLFREDLYYRLAVVEVCIPALRERPLDIPALARHFFRSIAHRLGRRAPEPDGSFMEALARHPWPGNVRELRNVIERVLVLVGSGSVTAEDLPSTIGRAAGGPPVGLPVMSLKEAERWAIIRALQYTGGKKGETIKLLGTSWPTLNKKIKDYEIDLFELKDGGTS